MKTNNLIIIKIYKPVCHLFTIPDKMVCLHLLVTGNFILPTISSVHWFNGITLLNFQYSTKPDFTLQICISVNLRILWILKNVCLEQWHVKQLFWIVVYPFHMYFTIVPSNSTNMRSCSLFHYYNPDVSLNINIPTFYLFYVHVIILTAKSLPNFLQKCSSDI